VGKIIIISNDNKLTESQQTTVDGLVLVAFAPTYLSLQTEFINRASVAQLVRAESRAVGRG